MYMDQLFQPSQRQGGAAMSTAASSGDSESSLMLGHISRLNFPRSVIDINLNNHFSAKVYTSSSPVSGSVSITTRRDVRFENIQVLLVGTSRTRVDGLNSPHEVTHTFLKLQMPISEAMYPVPRIMEAGRTITVPFNFVIPNHLTINACNHHMISEQLQDHHVLLPPTMGSWDRDDMAPQMAHVDYSVKARVFRESNCEGPRIKVMEASKDIHILPASTEQPPLSVTKVDRLYNMSKSKTLRRNLFSGKLGQITADAVQPNAVILRPDGRGLSSTTAEIQLKFEPASAEAVPPTVTGVTGKIVAHTFYSSAAITNYPNHGDWTRQLGVDKRGCYPNSTAIPALTLKKPTQWAQHIAPGARRDSGYSSVRESSEFDSEGGPSPRSSPSTITSRKMRAKNPSVRLHGATLHLPINLPADKKIFLPTFHSCIVSRVYTLQLSLSLSSGSISSMIDLSLPLQIAVDTDHALLGVSSASLPSFEAAVEEAAADDFFRPRTMQIPDSRYMETSMLPGYRDLIVAR